MLKLHTQVLVIAFLSALTGTYVFGQAGNNNPTGAAGDFNGDVTTGCQYDPYTGNAKRSVTDLVVAGGVGAYPLEFIRVSNSRGSVVPGNSDGGQNGDFGSAGNWLHSYQWSIDPKAKAAGAKPTSFAVNYPDGRGVSFAASTNGDPYYRGRNGVRDRLQVFWDSSTAGRAYLIMPDGGKVWFAIAIGTGGGTSYYTYTLQGVIDPYGQTTAIMGSPSSGLVTITEPAGRWIKLYYIPTGNGNLYIIDHLTASDGRTIQYGYTASGHTSSSVDPWLTQVTYFNDQTVVATYTYQAANVSGGNSLLRTCIDPMYTGPMWKIAYNYATALNPDGTAAVYGQILSENYFDGTNIGAAVSTLTINTPTTRTETRGDAKTRTFTYNTTPLLTNWTDFRGVSSSQTYDANSYVNAITDRDGHTTNFTKNAFTGGLLTATFPSTPGDTPPNTPRGVVTYTYGSSTCPDPNNRDANNPYYIYSITDQSGHVTTYLRDASKRVTQINYPDGGTESSYYNSFGQITSHTMRTSGTETLSYDARGLKQTYRDAYHASGNPSTWYQYDSLDRVLGITDALGSGPGDVNHTTSFSYNSRGQALVITLPVDPVDGHRHTITNAYNTNDTLASMTDQLGHVTNYTYDDYKRLRTISSPGHNTPLTGSTFYDTNGVGEDYTHTDANAKWVLSPGGKKIKNVYDENYRKTSATQAFGTTDAATTSFGYDNVGNVTSMLSPNEQPGELYSGFSTTTTYDERNRPMSISDSQNNITTFKYDASGRRASITRPNGQITTYDSYDAMNRLLQQTVKQTPDPDAVTKYTYYTSGLLQTMKDPRLVATNSTYAYTYSYDLIGRKTGLQYPPDSYNIQRSELWHYDSAGRIDTFTNRAGNVQTFTYDALNRQNGFSWNDGLTPSVTFGYDIASRNTSVVNSNSTISRAYFNDNLLNTETTTYTDNTPRMVTYTYDQDYNRATIQYPNGAYSFTYQYTGRNQLLNLINNSGNVTNATYNYDKDNNATYRGLDNGTSSSFTNDVLDRVVHISHSLTGAIPTFDYGYDSIGNRLWTKRDGGNGDVFGYDLNDQSTSVLLNLPNPDTTGAGSQTISYDANGNRTTFSAYGPADTYTTDNLNQYTQRNSSTASYDTKGNMTAGFDGSPYAYDAQNRLLIATKGGTTETFAYDGLNRQVSRTIGVGQPVYNVYDGWNLIAEYAAGSNTPTNAYLSGSNGLVKNLITNQYYYQDALGSTSHVADGSGALLEWYRYDLHGTPFVNGDQNNHVSAFGVRHLFTGQQWYSELGLYDLRTRFYSPDIGRFLQADPSGFAGDASNLYRYCRSNPQKWRDPSGLSTQSVAGPSAKNPDPNTMVIFGDLWGSTYSGMWGGSWGMGGSIGSAFGGGMGDVFGGAGNLAGIGNLAGPYFGEIPSAFELGQPTPTATPLFPPLPPIPGVTPIPTLPPNPFATPSLTPGQTSTPTSDASNTANSVVGFAQSQCQNLPFNQCQDCARQAVTVSEGQKDSDTSLPVYDATTRQLIEYRFRMEILNETLCGQNPSQYGRNPSDFWSPPQN
jgi:RHS repeat-associated protein